MHVVRAVSPVVRGSVGPVARGFPSAVLVLCLLAAGCSYAPDSRARLTGEAKTVETAAGVTVRLGARQVLLADGLCRQFHGYNLSIKMVYLYWKS